MSEPTADAEPVLLDETSGHVRVLTLNRPAKKNALSDDLVDAIIEGFASAAADDAVRVVGLTGAGDAVCSGLEVPFSEGLALERELQQQLFLSSDAKEGIAAHVEKRKPEFTGN